MTEQFESKIKAIVDSMTSSSFNYIFSTKKEANHILEKTPMPVVINVLPVSGTMEVKPLSINVSPNCLIGFFDKLPDMNHKGVDVKEINNRMFLAAEEFIAKVNASGKFKKLTSITYQNIEEYDISCYGVVLDVQLTELEGTQTCSLK